MECKATLKHFRGCSYSVYWKRKLQFVFAKTPDDCGHPVAIKILKRCAQSLFPSPRQHKVRKHGLLASSTAAPHLLQSSHPVWIGKGECKRPYNQVRLSKSDFLPARHTYCH